MYCARWSSTFLATLLLLQLALLTHECQRQVCRRKRSVFASKTTIKLSGCTARAPQWVRQVAYCLKLNAPEMALTIRSWYQDKYPVCEDQGCRSSRSNSQKSVESIDNCVICWKALTATLLQEAWVKKFNVTEPQVIACIDKYIYAFLDHDLPVLTSESSNRFKGNVKLAKERPAEYWWSVTVKLPCRPPVFEYVNAYCANSFADGAGNNEFVLVQNKLITAQDITFYADFSDTCRFTEDDIDIIWGESLPAASLPQISTFPSQNPPKPSENVQIYYDSNAFLRLMDTDGKLPEEVKISRPKSSFRKTRATDEIGKPKRNQFSILFPCSVTSFKIDERQKDEVDVFGAGKAFLITGNKSQDFSNTLFNFSLDYGFDKTGCVFESRDTEIAPGDLLFKTVREFEQTRVDKRFACIACDNMSNEIDCNDMGEVKYCHSGEICQSEIRQITLTKTVVKKSCKQRKACDVESIGRKNSQCKPGMPGSVCRCCCITSMCNTKHNSCSL